REPHGGPRVALRSHVRYFTELAKSLNDGRGFGRGDHDVQIADCFFPAAETARDVDLVDAAAGLQVLDDRARVVLGLVYYHAFLPIPARGGRNAFPNLVEQLG